MPILWRIGVALRAMTVQMTEGMSSAANNAATNRMRPLIFKRQQILRLQHEAQHAAMIRENQPPHAAHSPHQLAAKT